MASSAPFVLVHGGYHGAWCWQFLTPLLTRPALAVDLPGRGSKPADLDQVGIEMSADSVVADIDAAGFDRVVLVGHSLGGATLPAIARCIPERVEHLVFISTLVARDGKSIIESMPEHLQEQSRQRLRIEHGAVSTISREHHREQLCNDLSEEQCAFVLDRVGPDSLHFFHDRVDWSKVPVTIPRTYVRLRQDRALVPDMQLHMIENLRANGGRVDVREIDSGHQVMISQPHVLASLLESL
ncbi:MAG TPA: alpha/beta fold hydrolase [Acidimicrobiales bacterium]